MTAPAPQPTTSARPAFDLLHTIVGNGYRSERHIKMNPKGASAKYSYVKRYDGPSDHEGEHLPITDEEILEHLEGHATYGVVLIGADGLARAGLAEQDHGGEDRARALITAAQVLDVHMGVVVCAGADGHNGCHPWVLYADRHDPVHIRYHQELIARRADAETDELYPSQKAIRLPGGQHTHTGDYGVLLLTTGERFDLNDPHERAVGLAAWCAMPRNAAPPTPPKAEPKPIRATTKGATLAGQSPIAQFNASHTMRELLLSYGATETRGGWACNCGVEHSHTNQLAITDQGNLVSYSTRCRWAPHYESGKCTDAFGLYCLVEHGGRVKDAVAALLPEKRIDKEQPRYTQAERDARRKDAERKKAARKAEAAELRADVEARAAADATLTPCDRAVLDTLLLIAGDRGWCRPSKERIAEMCGYSLGSVKRALAKDGQLEGRYITSEGDGGGPNLTAIRTFLRGSLTTFNDPRVDHKSKTLGKPDHACERAPTPAPERACEPDSPDTWAWCEDAHGADELNALEGDEHGQMDRPNAEDHATGSGERTGTRAPVQQPRTAPRVQRCGPRWCAWYGDGRATWHCDEASAWAALGKESDAAPAGPGASYNPALDFTAGGVFTSIAVDSAQPSIVLIDPPALGDEAPLVRCPPSDPARRQRYYALLGKAKKVCGGNPAQAQALRFAAAALEEYRPPGEADAARVAPRSQAPSGPGAGLVSVGSPPARREWVQQGVF